VAVVKEMCF